MSSLKFILFELQGRAADQGETLQCIQYKKVSKTRHKKIKLKRFC